MLVCVCKGISDKHIDAALAEGATSLKAIKSELGLGSCCGQCVSFAKEMLADKMAEMQISQAFHLAHEIRV